LEVNILEVNILNFDISEVDILEVGILEFGIAPAATAITCSVFHAALDLKGSCHRSNRNVS
jgi:hypothetical protein